MEEKKEEKWLMPDDIKVTETNKPEEMLLVATREKTTVLVTTVARIFNLRIVC